MEMEKKSHLNLWNYRSSTQVLCNLIRKRENKSSIETHLRKGVDIDAKDSKGYTPLLLASELRRKDIFNLLIKCGANVDHSDDEKNMTALHFAINNGWKWLGIVQLLVNRVSDLDARDHRGLTALHTAVSCGNLKMVKSLVEAGADINLKCDHGATPLVYAAASSYKDVFDLLLDAGANVDGCDSMKRTVLHHVAVSRWAEVVPSLVKRIPDVNARCESGKTALHIAALSGCLKIVKCLVEAGADINAKCHRDATPLLYAAAKTHKDIFDWLLNAGSNVDSSWNDLTVLHWAAFYGWADAVQYLAKRLPDLEASGITEDTALHIGTVRGHLEVVKNLVEMKANINARNQFGYTALIIACQMAKFDIAEYLIQMNASCYITSIHGNSPLHYLIKMARPSIELIKLFITKAADLHPDDFTALLKSPLLKEAILQNVEFCCQAIVNKYNNHELPELYKLPVAGSLPCIERIKIRSQSKGFETIERTVRFEIQEKGHCDFYYVHLKMLNVLCVKSLLKHYGKKI